MATAAAAMSVVSTVSATVSLDYVGMGIGQTVDVVAKDASDNVLESVNNVFAGIYKIRLNAGPVLNTFCIDVADSSGDGPAEIVSLANAPDSWAGPMGVAAATTIEKLWAKYYTGATASAPEAAALQLAIWMAIDTAKTDYYLTFSGNPTATARASAMLGDLGTVAADLAAVTTPDFQDFIVPVPEPTTIIAGALLLLPLAVSTMRKARRQKT